MIYFQNGLNVIHLNLHPRKMHLMLQKLVKKLICIHLNKIITEWLKQESDPASEFKIQKTWK